MQKSDHYSEVDYLCLIISIIITAITFFIYKNSQFNKRVLSGYFTFLTPLIYIQFITFVYIGSYLAFFLKEQFQRLDDISINSISIYLLSVTYSFLILVLSLSLLFYFTNEKQKEISFKEKIILNPGLSSKKLFFLFTILAIYVIYNYTFNFSKSPLFFLISGNPLEAEKTRFLSQTNQITLNIKYISKLIEIIGFYLVISTYINWKIYSSSISKWLFILSFIFSSINLIFDAQKAPIIMLLACLFFVNYSIHKKIKSIILIFSLILFILILINVITSVQENINFSFIISILDRAFIGQNQGFYYIYDYLPIQYDNLLNWISSTNFVQADQVVIKYISYYYGNNNIVNTNTFYLGEAWHSLGYIGLIISPLIVSFVIIISILILNIFLAKNYTLYFPLAIYTFMTIPITRSLYQMISFKFLFYTIVFGILPIYILKSFKYQKKK